MKSNTYKTTIIFLFLLLCTSLVNGSGVNADEKGDILVHLRLYEGSRGNEVQKSSVVSSYYLKPMFVSNLVSQLDIQEEQKELKRIFNLSSIKMMTRTQWGWKYGRTEKKFRIVVLNGHEFIVRLTLKGKKNGFKVEVFDNAGQKSSPLFETDLELPQKKSTVFGFEDSLRKPFFICLQREENQSIIDKEPLSVSSNRPKLIKRVTPLYPEQALKKNIQGQVILDATTDKKGNVADLHVVEGIPVLNKAAQEAVSQWQYEPFIKDGKQRPIRFTVIIHFNLPRDYLDTPKESAVYFGQLMDFNFNNADLMDVLKFIALKEEINIVVDPGLTGYKVTCQLEQVPWDKALDWMLQLNRLDMVFKGNVLRILKAAPGNKRLKKSLAGKVYSGKPMGINFKDASLRDVLNIFSKIGGIKIDVERGIEGRVTCNIKMVPWDQALDLMLQLNGLEMHKEGEIFKIFKRVGNKKSYGKSDKKNENIPDILPVRGYLNTMFGWRKNALTGKKTFYPGIEIAAKEGTDIIAPANGVVMDVLFDKNYGQMIIIDHGDGFKTRYGRLKKVLKKKGEKIIKGNPVATVGNSGNGPFRLHYEVHFQEKPVNPLAVGKRD